MRFSIEPDDRKLLGGAALVLVVASLIAALLGSTTAVAPSYPSSYSTAAGGARAAYLLLGQLGCPVERWVKPPQDLPARASNTLLVLADPQLAATADERSAILNFVARGGRVLLTGATGASILGLKNLKRTPSFNLHSEELRAETPSPLTRGAPVIRMDSTVRWPHTSPREIRTYGDGDGAAVIAYRMGRGEVIWWAGSSPLTNSGLQQANNLALFLNTANLDTRPRVLWDEYYHNAGQGFWAYAGATPLPWGVIQVVLILLALGVTFSRRSGPLRPLAKESRLAPLEFVETLGGLYQRKHAANTALEISYRRFRLRLQRRLGVSASTPASHFADLARLRIEWSAPKLRHTIEECERCIRQPDLPERQALLLIRSLDEGAKLLGIPDEFTGGGVE
ncbi:MAG: DUF4350 domain-containing protein [Terriglobia bacterium]